MLGTNKKIIKNFFLLAVANFCFFTGIASFHLLPVYLAKLNATKTYIGVAMGIMNIFQMLMIIFLLNKIDFINKRKLLIYTAIFTTFLYLMFFFFANLYTIPVLRAFQGIAHGIGFPVGISLALDIIPQDKRVGLLGLFGISGAVSNVAGPPAMEWLMNAFEAHYAFLFPVGISVIWLIFLLLLKIDGKPEKKVTHSAPFKMYFKIIPLAVFFGSIFGTFFSFISDYSKELGLTPYSIFFHLYAVALVLVRFTFVKKLNLWKRHGVVIFGYSIGVIALLAGFFVNYASHILFVALIGFLYGTAHGFLYPSLNVLFVETTPNRKGKATLTFIIFLSFGMGASSLINGLVADLTGYSYMYLIFAFASLLITLYFASKKTLFKAAQNA